MTTIDWGVLARNFRQAQLDVQNEGTWRGEEYYAEMLRRTLGYQGASEHIPYETVRAPGLTTTAEADYTRNAHLIVERSRAGRLQCQVEEARAKATRDRNDVARDLAGRIRERASQHHVSSRLRREGVLLAADLIDPDITTRREVA